MTDGPTTDRAQRQQAVASGARSDAVERLSRRSNPGGSAVETPSRQRQQRAARDVAGEIDVDREGVGTVDRIRGLDVFLRSEGTEQFGDNLRSEFAAEADFVQEEDVDPNVDPEAISATPAVAPDRRDDVAERAREGTAADARFIEGADLAAEVGPRGVRDVRVAAGRRDDVAARARQGLASGDPFAEPGDFSAEVTESGIESAGLTDQGARRRASRQFAAETPLQEADTDDVTATGDGFALDDAAQRRVAARRFEADTETFGTGELDPASDVRETGDGFGLAEGPARELAADRLDDQLPEVDVSAGAIDLRNTGDGFEAIFEQEVSR